MITALLPEERVRPARPCTVRCDFEGLIYLKNNKKSHSAQFTCAVTRAVHLELLPDMTAVEFRIALV